MTNQITNDQAVGLIALIREAINIGKAGTDVEPMTEMGMSANFALLLDLEVIKPRYVHDCGPDADPKGDCKFLGQHGVYDLWVHPYPETLGFPAEASIIARGSNEPSEYHSAPQSIDTQADWFVEGKRRAERLGLIRR